MAGTNREVTLTLSTESTGAENVRRLADEFKRLGAEGGKAAPEFDALGKELDELSRQTDVLDAFDDISTRVKTAKAELDAATAALARHDSALGDLRNGLRLAQAAEEQAAQGTRAHQTALEQASIGYKAARASVDAWKAAIAASGTATAEQNAGLSAASAELAKYRAGMSAAAASIARLAPAHQLATAATKDAQRAVDDEARAQRSATAALDGAAAAHKALSKTAGDVGAAMKSAGLDSAKFGTEQARVSQAVLRVHSDMEALRGTLAQTARAAQIDVAFNTVGARSPAALRAEIDKVNAAMALLRREGNLSASELGRAFTAAQGKISGLEAQINGADAATKRMGGSVGNMTGLVQRLAAPLAAVFGLQKFIDANLAMDSSERALRAITGTATSAAKEMSYLKDVSARLGIELKSSTEQYVGLLAAAKDTGITGQQVRGVFEAVAGSMAVLGRSSMDTENALRAVQQMMTKGVVSMEELRQQLGEKLPGALQGTAKGLGLTTEELVKLVSQGKLTAGEVLPALTRSLEDMYNTSKKVVTFQSELTRVTNKLTLALSELGQSGVMQFLIGTYETLVSTVGAASLGLTFFGRTIGNTVAFLVDLKSGVHGTTEAVATFRSAMRDAMDDADESAKQLAAGAGGATDKVKDLGEKLVDVGNGVQVAASRIGEGAPSFVKLALSMLQSQEAADKHASAMSVLTEARKKEGEGIVAAANALGTEADQRKAAATAAANNTVAVEQEIEALRKAALARRLEVAAREQQIATGAQSEKSQKENLKLLAEQLEKLDAEIAKKKEEAEAYRLTSAALRVSAEAYQDNSGRVAELASRYAAAKANVDFFADAQRAGLEVSQKLKAADEEAAIAGKLYSDAVKDQAAELRAVGAISKDELAGREAEIAAMELQLDALQKLGNGRSDEAKSIELSVAQLEVERQAFLDNSGAVGKYRFEYEAAKATLAGLVEQRAAGVDVTDKLAAAEVRYAKALALYKDAAGDAKANLEALSKEKQASISLDQADVRYQIEVLRTKQKLAEATGNEAEAIKACNEIKRLEIRLAGLVADAKRAEADAALALVAAERESLRMSGLLTPTKEAELRAAEASAKVKGVEADIARETAQQLQNLQNATEGNTQAAGNSRGASLSAAEGFDAVGKSASGAAKGVEQLTAAEKELNIVKRAVSTQTIDHRQLAVQYGLTNEEDIAAFSEAYGKQLTTRVTQMNQRLSLTPIDSKSYQNEYFGASRAAIQDALNAARTRKRADTTAPSTSTSAPSPAPVTASATGDYSIHTVKIELPNGASGSVNTASRGDSQALVDMLKQLGTDKGRAA